MEEMHEYFNALEVYYEYLKKFYLDVMDYWTDLYIAGMGENYITDLTEEPLPLFPNLELSIFAPFANCNSTSYDPVWV